MRAEFNNGVSVHRLWSDGATERLAVLQYNTDAKSFIEHLLQRDAANRFNSDYAIFNSYDATLTIVRRPKVEERSS